MASRLAIPAPLKSRERLGRFAVVGGIGFLVDQTVLLTLVELTAFSVTVGGHDLTLEAAKVVSAETAIVVMFLINDRWTFQAWGDHDRRSQRRRLLKSNAVRVAGIAVATVVLSVLVRTAGMNVPVANAIGILCGFLVNYTLETLYTWRLGR